MKIEVDAELVEQVVICELKEWARMADEFDGEHPEDVEFWKKMGKYSKWILKHNFHVR